MYKTQSYLSEQDTRGYHEKCRYFVGDKVLIQSGWQKKTVGIIESITESGLFIRNHEGKSFLGFSAINKIKKIKEIEQ